MGWVMGLAGGLMIGCAAALFLLGNGRIMGASGLIAGLMRDARSPGWAEGAVFVAALFTVPALLQIGLPVDTHATRAPLLLIAAGLCVGIGTRLANGCTSGHGVCGMPRLSRRSIAATLIYIGAGVLTVAGLRAAGGL